MMYACLMYACCLLENKRVLIIIVIVIIIVIIFIITYRFFYWHQITLIHLIIKFKLSFLHLLTLSLSFFSDCIDDGVCDCVNFKLFVCVCA